ncbi:MAG: hypothetical protein ACR2LL_01350 [Nitrosopumilus sp.]|uniref:hypothetical protein n=1 Tax=Nitrosopumilus sp. TaxID=2024843 RepID=UPI002930F71D|nr:hypothetical protein [Nitrosopumilus sp.]
MALIPFLTDIFQNPVFSIIAIFCVFGIGIFQGIILGRAILVRFPRLQNHVKTVSISLFLLFLTNAVLSVPRFASPEKIDFSTLSDSYSNEAFSTLFLIFGTNTGFLTVLAISVTVMTFVILKFTHLHGITKGFIFFFTILLLLLTGLSRLTDLTPSSFEVLLYFLYQLGITIGILTGTIRKIKTKKLDLK